MDYRIKLYLCFLSFAIGCFSKSDPEISDYKSDTSDGKIIVDPNIFKHSNKSYLEFIVDSYADSVNMYFDGQLPTFLKDRQFDVQHSGILSSFHNPLPLRKMIMDKVTNCEALAAILKDISGEYRKKPELEISTEDRFLRISIHELAEQRAIQLKCE